MNILLKNVIDACAGAIAYYCIGFGVAYGNHSEYKNAFIGTDYFALANYDNFSMFLFQYAFAATAATIVSGSVAERCAFEGYLFYSIFLTAFAQPVVAHWVWDVEGWISPFAQDPLWGSGLVDFSGCGAVHMVGGLAGLMGAWTLGPRTGRFDPAGVPVDMPGHSAPLVVSGTFILWFGWYGFNPGSMFLISTPTAVKVVSRAAVTTTLAGASGGSSLLFIKWITSKGKLDLVEACNGALVGLVGITAGCSVVEPWAAIIAGIGAAVTFDLACRAMMKLRIDDPLAAAPMHGACGIWGLVFTAFFAKKEYLEQAYGWTNAESYGIFYGGDGRLLACQLVGVVAIAAWTCVLLGIFFKILMVSGKLRVPLQDELNGMDMSHHGGQAYNLENVVIHNPAGSKYNVELISAKSKPGNSISPLDGLEVVEEMQSTVT
eukprot:CAMPEP_0196585648 /NCGR_PEP_ID=MMETSP1081-20130531/51478_1 /TAXON_ID=36882 /ORGANISM="Pyramimonas amylifera, Strain CCMP720" /LENGTH=432 /DNA_ID=CAMNT_0041907263 /DNA_START=515 /DNA_END=1813 /DNA_ORIENTATION=+